MKNGNLFWITCTLLTKFLNFSLVSTPKFSTATDLHDGEPISFICNVSFSGIATSSIAIEDSKGRNFTDGNYTAKSRGLHNFTLTYDVTANSSIDQIYWCNVTLTNDSSNSQIYSTKLEASVQWSKLLLKFINTFVKLYTWLGRVFAI